MITTDIFIFLRLGIKFCFFIFLSFQEGGFHSLTAPIEMSIFSGFRGVLSLWKSEKGKVLFFENIMSVFKEKKTFGRKKRTTFCGSPVIGMNPPSRPSLRTHLMILVPDCAITKPKLFLIPEAEHCGLNYYGFLSMTVTVAKVYLVSDCSVKNPYPIRWHIPYSPYIGVPRPRSCSQE